MKNRTIEINPKGRCALFYAVLAVFGISAWVYHLTGQIHPLVIFLVIVFFALLIDIWFGLTRHRPEYMRRK